MYRIVFRTLPTRKISWKSHKAQEAKFFKSLRSYSLSTKGPICPPPPPKKSKKTGLAITLGIIALGCGATIWYAKQDDDFRDVLTEYVPFTDTIIRLVFGEPGAHIGNPLDVIQGFIKTARRKQEKAFIAKEEKEEPKKEYVPPSPIMPLLEKPPDDKCYNEIRLEIKEEGQEEPDVVIAGDPKPSEDPLPETHPKVLEDLEGQICEAATEAVNAYNDALFYQKVYNSELELIIDNNIDQIQPKTWEDIKHLTHSKAEKMHKAERAGNQAAMQVNKLKELIASPEYKAPESDKVLIRSNVNKVLEDIEEAKTELEKEKKIGIVAEKYWDKVQKARQHFSEELETLFPDIDITQKKLKVKEEDIDLFLLHCYATILYYQKELAAIETIGKERMKAAFEAIRSGKGEAISPSEVCEMIEQEKRKLTLCFQQQCLKLRKQTEDEMREQMKRQSQAFHDHLEEAIRTRELEIERELTRQYDEKLEEERCKYKIELAAIVGRLRGLDHAMKARREADTTAKQAQILWSACQALTRSLRSGCPGKSWKDQIRPLEPELNAVKKAAGKGDTLVEAVLSGIPEEARTRGVFPEDALRERFLKVEKVARNVALVPEGGAALPIHFLSYLQGLLLLKAASPIPQAELNDEETDFTKLNTNDILQRARYWLDRGNLEQTLKYMNLLSGASRCVAKQWMNETRILLETQQAANILMAHAASSGLSYL